MRWFAVAILIGCCLPGCMVLRVTVKNPIPEMTVIAVTPFRNLTQEPSSVVDGRRFALAYYSELQKTKGFQVIPVGVVETAILQNQLDMNDSRDVLALSEILHADAVVVGAITDYSPYYPPRIGMQVDWYSPFAFPMDVPQDEGWGTRFFKRGSRREFCEPIVRAQSAPESPAQLSPIVPLDRAAAGLIAPPEPSRATFINGLPADKPAPRVDLPQTARNLVEALPKALSTDPSDVSPPLPPPSISSTLDPTAPLMSYTRLFDGADADLVNKLRDYLELRGDRRSGSWEAYLHRSEDFIRFSAHLMIVEMLAVHGGAEKTQVVFKWRKYN